MAVTSTDLVLPGIAAWARGERPEPVREDEGEEWSEGMCWLYCGHRWTRVMWIGPASTGSGSATAPIQACRPCIARLDELIWSYLHHCDGVAPVNASAQTPAGRARSGRHRGRSGLLRRF